MAKLVYGLNQSLDGYVDHTKFGPSPELFRFFIEEVRSFTGFLHGTRMYGLMRYWDEEPEAPQWEAHEREFAAAWRSKPKWVVSRSLKSVGPNATLATEDAVTLARRLKAEQTGLIEVGGTVLAQSLTEAGLIDEYRIYLHPVALGKGTPYFAGPAPRLRLAASDRLTEDVVRLRYVPA